MLNRRWRYLKRPIKVIIRLIILIMLAMINDPLSVKAQVNWTPVTDVFGTLPVAVKIFKSKDPLENAPSVMYYAEINMKDPSVKFMVDTTLRRRLTPQEFYKRNGQPALVVNCSFFEFQQNRNVNLIVQQGKVVAFDTPAVSRRGKDTLTYLHTLGSAFGVNRNKKMDIVYQFNDSSLGHPYAQQFPLTPVVDSNRMVTLSHPAMKGLKKWKVVNAVGGGPVLVREGAINITNNEERKFAGKAIADKHPRTAIGYTAEGKLIILAVQGRMKGLAEGATLTQLAEIMKGIGCIEAMNLDGGGSSCMLVNGKETIKPSDPTGQRPVPAVIIIQ